MEKKLNIIITFNKKDVFTVGYSDSPSTGGHLGSSPDSELMLGKLVNFLNYWMKKCHEESELEDRGGCPDPWDVAAARALIKEYEDHQNKKLNEGSVLPIVD
jgi:hypothetical protein